MNPECELDGVNSIGWYHYKLPAKLQAWNNDNASRLLLTVAPTKPYDTEAKIYPTSDRLVAAMC